MPGVTRGKAGGRAARCLCVQRGFLLPRTSCRLSTSAPESLCPPKPASARLGCQFPRGSSACAADEWARRRRCGACLWRSCTSGVQCMAQLAAGDAAAPEGGAAKRAVRGASHTGLGDRRVGFRGALQLELVGARCAAPAALLRCESPVPPHPGRVHAACAKANERAARGSQGVARVLGTGGSGGGGPLAKVQRNAPRRGVLAAGGGKGGGHRFCARFFCAPYLKAPFFLHRTKKHGS